MIELNASDRSLRVVQVDKLRLCEAIGVMMNRSPLQAGVVRSRVDRLDDGDVAGGEAGFAVFQVVVPGADEGFVEAQGADLAELGVEGFVPDGEGAGVIEAEVFEVVEEHVAGLVDGFVDSSDGEEQGSGEDDFLDPIDAFGEGLVAVVGDGDVLDSQ